MAERKKLDELASGEHTAAIEKALLDSIKDVLDTAEKLGRALQIPEDEWVDLAVFVTTQHVVKASLAAQISPQMFAELLHAVIRDYTASFAAFARFEKETKDNEVN